MSWMIEFVSQLGEVEKIYLVDETTSNPLDVMDENFDEIKEFIGEGYVETVRVQQRFLALVHEEGGPRGFLPNVRADLHHFLGPVVLIKPTVRKVVWRVEHGEKIQTS